MLLSSACPSHFWHSDCKISLHQWKNSPPKGSTVIAASRSQGEATKARTFPSSFAHLCLAPKSDFSLEVTVGFPYSQWRGRGTFEGLSPAAGSNCFRFLVPVCRVSAVGECDWERSRRRVPDAELGHGHGPPQLSLHCREGQCSTVNISLSSFTPQNVWRYFQDG